MIKTVNDLNAIDFKKLDKFQIKDYEGQLKASSIIDDIFGKYEDVTVKFTRIN